MALSALKICGILHHIEIGYNSINSAVILPMATGIIYYNKGMSLTLCLLTLRKMRPLSKYVVFPRIDQKTCLKCIFSANLVPIVVENILKGDELHTNIDV